MMFPHELFAALYHDYPEIFKERVCPDRAVLRSFWHSQADNPQLQNHPMKDTF